MKRKCRHPCFDRVDLITGGLEFEHKVVAYRCRDCRDYIPFGPAGPGDELELATARLIADFAAKAIDDLGNPWKSIWERDHWLSDRIDLLVRCYLAARRARQRGRAPRQAPAPAARGFTRILIGAA